MNETLSETVIESLPERTGTHRSDTTFHVMGTTAQLVMIGELAPSPERMIERLTELERRWSRFLPGSELSRVNASCGRPSIVSHDTAVLVERSVRAWTLTGGRFDPTVLDAVLAAGYDRTFESLAGPIAVAATASPAPGCGGIEVDSVVDLVRLPAGVHLDPGGLGKGLAADLVATEAVDLGAEAALVSLGGDLRVAGTPPPEGWELELDHHVAPLARINLLDGAIATSSTIRRRWRTTDGEAHHVIDPRTGRPTTGRAVACTVLASEAWWAEALATALLVGWGEPDLDLDRELAGLLVDAGALVTLDGGEQLTLGAFAGSFSPGSDRTDEEHS